MVVKKDKAEAVTSIGQVFTPDYVAKFMIKNALSFLDERKLKVLEPSVGKGVFLRKIFFRFFRKRLYYLFVFL